MYTNHFKDIIKWIPATVYKKISHYTYLINVNNSIRYVHKNQLRLSNLADKYHPLISNESTAKFKISNNNNNNNKKQKRILHESIPLRKSTRVKKKPIRLYYK